MKKILFAMSICAAAFAYAQDNGAAANTGASATQQAVAAQPQENPAESLADLDLGSKVLDRFSAAVSVGFESEYVFRGIKNAGLSVNPQVDLGYDFGAVLGSNISENVDFTFSWNGTYNEATNSLNATKAKNRYFNHRAQGDVKIVFPLGFTLTASAAYTQYIGFTNDYDSHYLLCNAYIGKKVFRNQQGEIMFGVNDMFNQNKAFARTTGSGWTQNATNSVIGRYYMVQFTYNLRHFGKKGSTNIKDYDGMDQSGSRRRMGPGGPGGPPPMGPRP